MFCSAFRFFILGVFLSVSAVVGTATAQTPSFNCENARTALEIKICEDDLLGALDLKLAHVYNEALEKMPDNAETIRASQAAWLTHRNKCQDSPAMADCLKREYALRISEIQAKYSLLPVQNTSRYACLHYGSEATAEMQAMTYETIVPVLVLKDHRHKKYITYLGRAGGNLHYTGEGAKLYRESGESVIEIGGNKFTCRAV